MLPPQMNLINENRMIVTESQGVKHLLKIAVPYLLFSCIYAGIILGIEEFAGDQIYQIPTQIGSVFGLAIAFFLGFRMNSAYDRWWEARKIFGELTNNTRSFVTKIYVYYGNENNVTNSSDGPTGQKASDLISLTIEYVRQLKREMHNQKEPSFEEETVAFFSKYGINLKNKVSNELLVAITQIIEGDFSPKAGLEKNDLMQHMNRFYEIQGKAERIKNTPFLMIYSAFTRIIVTVYILLIPLFIGDIDLGGEKSNLELLAIPIMVIISTVFLTVNKLANLFGEPFSESATSVSIDQICQTIENNCLEIKQKTIGLNS